MYSKLLKSGLRCRDVLELVIPSATFIIMLIAFVLGIVFRYIFRSPLPWINEVCTIMYVWTVLFGASYSQRTRSHVAFTVVYDLFPLKIKFVASFLGNLLMLLALSISFVPTLKYIAFIGFTPTNMLEISLSIVYMPFLIFLLSNIFYLAYETYGGFMVLFNLGGQKIKDRFLDYIKNDTDRIIGETGQESLDEVDVSVIYGKESDNK